MNPTILVQAMLPHKEQRLLGADGEPLDVPDGLGGTQRLLATHYSATNGDFTLSIRAGLKRSSSVRHPHVSRGIPYGGLARLLLCYIVTEARTKKTRTIDLGRTITTFCKHVDITPSGGANGRIPYVVDQLQRLATAVVDFRWESWSGHGRFKQTEDKGESILIVDDYHFWHRGETASSEATDGGTITLSQKFWDDIVAECFPLDFRKAQFFRAYPTAYDLYLWLTYKLAQMERAHRAVVAVNYDQLHTQLGSHYQTDDRGVLTPKGKKNFSLNIRKALGAIRATWPGLDVQTPRGRLVIHATPPDVAQGSPGRR